MTEQLQKMVEEAAAHAAEHHPVALSEAVARLDNHCVAHDRPIWLAWCSIRQALLKEVTA